MHTFPPFVHCKIYWFVSIEICLMQMKQKSCKFFFSYKQVGQAMYLVWKEEWVHGQGACLVHIMTNHNFQQCLNQTMIL